MTVNNQVNLVECPRDAMQGLKWFIPTETKVAYLNTLLRVGFDTLDFGSFVSPKAIPQMRDTAAVLGQLNLNQSPTRLLAIVANVRGAEDALHFSEIHYLGFPFSISETFQQRNTNSSMDESLRTVEKIQSLCTNSGKELVVYISMAFGNPYGDEWSPELAIQWVEKMASLGVKIMAMSDTVGVAQPEDVSTLFHAVIPAFPGVNFGAHLHCTPYNWKQKVQAAWNAGCRRYDAAIKGYGGCPMAKDELVGNLATENLLAFLDESHVELRLDRHLFASALMEAVEVFSEPLQHENSTDVL